jgi:hypothetical protein
MPSILIIEKNGNIKSLSIKTFNEAELYKKAGFKTADNFKCAITWNVDIAGIKYAISLYGKTTGKANQENKYDFPPPVDSLLFFNNCILINNSPVLGIQNLSIPEWGSIYDHLFGGFEDIDNDDSEDEMSEDDAIDLEKRTRTGYVKDGFVIDDDETNSDESENNSEEEIVIPKKTKCSKVNKKEPKKEMELDPEPEPELYLDCASELSEEEYV